MKLRATTVAALAVTSLAGLLGTGAQPATAETAVQYLSDMAWTSASSGWGPVERDHSNGEAAAGDGTGLRIGGVPWAKGLGVHSASSVSVPVGTHTRFAAMVGVDNEVGAHGSVQFQVWADGVKLAETGVLRGGQAAVSVSVDVAGRRSLTLVVNDGGDGNGWDHADWADARLSGTTVAAPAGTVLFDADVANRGLGAYAGLVHPERIAVVDDPVLGTRRKVMKFSVYDTDLGPTDNPRAQVETPKAYGEGADIYVGWSALFPTSWPDALPAGGTSWVTMEEVYGPPYAGAAPVKVGMRSGTPALTIQRNTTYGWDIPWEQGPIVKNRWYDFVLHEKLSQNPGVGFFELWVNTGSGWRAQALAGQTRLYMKTLDSSNNGGLNYSSLKLYRTKGMYALMTLYYAEHRVGTTFDVVAPHSYS